MSGLNAPKIGWFLCRVMVPLWVATGAVFKLVELSPKTLPKETILNVANQWGINLYFLLATLIALELLAVVVMLMMARLARPMAILVLSVFCLILIGELVQGNLVNCGCFGDIPIPPWVMLAIDGALLLGVLLFDPTPVLPATPARWPVPLAVLLIVAGVGATFWRVIPAGRPPVVIPPVPGPPNPVTDPTANPSPAPLPSYWLADDLEAWIGKPWREIDLFTFMRKWPRDLDHGLRYVTFYGRTCEHCEEMFNYDLVRPELGSITTAVVVPHSKDELVGPDPFFLPATECEHLELPTGCEWLITTPLTVTVEDGIVTCAEEGSHTECMGLE
ncbi:MAG: MauE/DoxX family redox-associated membrane protein [Planctomycetota bacterium]|jgi:hypothetical protein